MILVAEGVAGGDVLDSDNGRNVARIAGLDVFAFVRLNLNQTRYALAFVRARIIDGVAFTEGARINSKENELAHKWIAPKLERERAKVAVVVRWRLHRLVRIGIHAFGRRNIQRAWEVIDHGVDQVLHAFILERRTRNDGHKLVRNCLTTNAGFQHLRWKRFFFENSLRNLVIKV